METIKIKDVEFDVECACCSKPLKATYNPYKSKIILEVEPCSDCTKDCIDEDD